MSADPETVARILDRAVELLTPRGAWTQGTYARDEDGTTLLYRPSGWYRPKSRGQVAPRCYCAIGAIRAATREIAGRALVATAGAACDAADRQTQNGCIASYNDAPSRRKSQVIAKLRKAAEAVRAEAADA